MSDLLKRLLQYLAPGVGDEDFPSDPGDTSGAPADLGANDGDSDADPGDFDLDDGSDPAAAAAQDQDDDDEQAPAPSRARARIERQQKENAELKQRLAALEAQLTRTPAQVNPPAPDPDLQRLNDPNLTDMERWQIQSNLTIRQTNAMAAQALQQAANMQDQVKFQSLMAQQPLLKKYEARVEAEVSKMRAAGQQVPPREAIADYLMGRDLREGKLKPSRKAASASGSSQAAPRVANNGRGQPTGARSDVPRRGSLTEAQKREQRLEGKLI